MRSDYQPNPPHPHNPLMEEEPPLDDAPKLELLDELVHDFLDAESDPLSTILSHKDNPLTISVFT